MNKRPTIGIMTYYAVQNFGAALQAFALQQNVERLGANAEFLRFFDKHNESISTTNKSALSLLLHNRKLQYNLLHFARFIRVKRYTKPNSIGFKNFQEKYLQSSIEPYYDSEDLRQANERYDGFISGSDMVWTPIGQDMSAYFLQFTDKDKRYSYAPSMTGCQTFTESDAAAIKDFLLDMNEISCREQEGVDYVKQVTGRDATLVIDPTLLFSKEEWRKELSITTQRPKKPYILCYNFGGLPPKIESEVYRIAKERNMDVRYIPLCHKESDAELKLGHHGPYGPREFVELFLNASFCVTNTFHGFLFSLISENPFVVIHREKGNAWKANETRISNLMDILGIVHRYIDLDTEIKEEYFILDYNTINERVKSKRAASIAYLKGVIDKIVQNMHHEGEQKIIHNVRDLTIKQCTGCGICSTQCSFHAIEMVENEEGFMVPHVDNNKCKECGKCAKFCPSIHPISKEYPIETKLCLSKDELIEKSASGGLFITIARYYIEKLNGVVYGVVMDDNFTCRHTEATTMKDLAPMQNSKYVQSIVGDCYAKVKKRLEDGRYVLFTGTPCQIAALKSYLKKDYDLLLTMDVVCHGVPNQLFWKTYLRHCETSNIQSYTFRNRANKRTWNPASRVPHRGTQEATIVASWGTKHIPAQQDAFYGPFVRCESYRMSCYYCQYARKERVSDITMGDCDSDKLYPSFYPYESKSIALINTDKGLAAWNKVKDLFASTELDYEKEIVANICLRNPSVMPSGRKNIYCDLKKLKWRNFSDKYIHKPTKLAVIKIFIQRILNNKI